MTGSRRLAVHNIGVFLIGLLIAIGALQPACAQVPGLSFRPRSFINPFPQTERYHLHVIGDGLAEGLAGGLQQAFENDGTVRIINSAKAGYGLARPDRNNWPQTIDELIKTQPMHIAVVMLGTNDYRNMYLGGNKYAVWGKDEWRDAYGKEIDKLIKALKDRNVAVYWVGLPVMQQPKMSEAMSVLNDIIRERTYVGNVKFIDSWNGFTDQSGGFSAFGPDLSGQTQRLREPDGMSFTQRGNRKLASYVEIIIRRDLAEAKVERNIPLAGDEEEQSRIAPKPVAKEAPKDAGKDSKTPAAPSTPDVKNPDTKNPVAKPADDPAAKPGTKEAAPAKGKEPQKGAAAPEAQTGQPLTPPGLRPTEGPPGETIMGDISDGVTSLATVSPAADLNAVIDAGERGLPVTERLYYRALVKGEALKSKPDRADDFKWPRG